MRYVRATTSSPSWVAWAEIEVYGAGGSGGSGAGEVNWLVADHLGTPRIIADLSGSLAGIRRHDYLPFGEEVGAGVSGRTQAQGYAGDNVRQQFTSKERDDETGLDYFLARYYSATQGRFTGPDEFQSGPREVAVLGSGDSEKQALVYADALTPQSLNKYQYCLNNPLRYIDPDGHDYRIREGKNSDGKLVRYYDWDSNYVYKKGDKNGAPANHTYIDVNGQAIQLWGVNSKDPNKEITHGYQVVTAVSGGKGEWAKEKYTMEPGEPPPSFVKMDDTIKALKDAGYVKFTLDPLHNGPQFFQEDSPTLHIALTQGWDAPEYQREGMTTYGQSRQVVKSVEFHADTFSQVSDLTAHMREAMRKGVGMKP